MSIPRVPSPNLTRRAEGRAPWLGLFVLAVLAGCGENPYPDAGAFYPVKGKVVLKDGKPLTSGSIELTAVKGPLVTPTGTIGPDGSFSLTTNGKEGAPAAEYRVKIVPDPSADIYTTRGKMKVRDPRKLPYSEKYLDEQLSELVVTVKPEPNDLAPIKLSNEPVASQSSARERGND